MSDNQAAPAYADPAFVGLLGFIFATTIANLGNAGITGNDATIWVGAIFGGIIQFIAGLYHFRTGNTLSMTIFCAYGAFWIITPVFGIVGQLKFLPVGTASTAAWLYMWALLSAFFMVTALWANKTLFAVLAFVAVGLALLGTGVVTSARLWTVAGGWSLLIAAGIACWLLVSGLVDAVSGASLSTGSAMLKSK